MDRTARQPPPQLNQCSLMLERVARLETGVIYEREMMTRLHIDLDRRLCRIERRMSEHSTPPPVGTAGWIKIAVAILIPIMVLMATGSPQQAAQVGLRIMGVSP